MIDELRLLMPQWQGGNDCNYYLGAKLLSWLAPNRENVTEAEVPVEPYDGIELVKKNGIVGYDILIRQLVSAQKIIEAYQPKKIIVFGGDCHISQAPFSYLNELYDGQLGVLWIDAHPDVSTPEMYQHEHAMVLGNLLGEGDSNFSAYVSRPIRPEHVMYAGLQKMLPKEEEIVARLNLRKAGSNDLADSSQPVLEWLAENNIKHLAIHFDLDVLDPALFRSIKFAEPGGPADTTSSRGNMTLVQVARLVQDVSRHTDIVGFAFAEHMPWDAINLQRFLYELPIF